MPKISLNYGVSYKLIKPTLQTNFSSNNQYSSFEASRERNPRLSVPDETTDDLMWLFGVFLGDGNIYRKKGKSARTRYAKVGFSVPKDDRAREKLLSVMGNLLKEAPTERVDGIHLVWNSVELADLIELNGFSGTARTKSLPDWVFSIPESQRLALLSGYLDADGCAVESKRILSLKSVNLKLLKDFSRLATTLGITSKVFTEFEGESDVTISGYPSTSHGSHRLEFRTDNRLLPHLSKKFSEKMESFSSAKLQYFRKIGRSDIKLAETLEITKAHVGPSSNEKVPTWDIEVEGTGNFVSEGFIVHNSRLTVKFPSVYLMGEGAKGEILSIAYANSGQHQHAGGKVIHAAPNTSSRITSKSISAGGGRTSYRGLVEVNPGAVNSKSRVECDALILDPESRSDTYPVMRINESKVNIEHEATVSKVGEEQLFYLMSRGLTKAEAMNLVVSGFIEPIVKELPLEYAVELNKLIELEMEGSVG
ncbi:SufD family Fe-S cluster assembly protein [candidate division WWE3 bacterium]|nr:SufD family Fe-S cluster assembly protein [candidate division WWE3 bacterium]